MKKRLISMLMAVLMIASLLPVSAVFAADDDCSAGGSHEYTKVSIKKDAEKKTPGVDFKVCKKCGEIKSGSIEIIRFKTIILGHKCSEGATMVAQEATCRNQGLTVSYCTECGKGFANKDFNSATYKVDAKLAHVNLEFHVVQAPTCQNDGWGYVVCEKCKDATFVQNAYKAVRMFSSADFNNDYDAYTNKVIAVNKMFAAVNPGHNAEKMPTVTKETKLDNGVVLMPAVKATHAATVTEANGNVIYVYKDADGNPITGAGYCGDKKCPYCDYYIKYGDEGILPSLNEKHDCSVKTNGKLPYLENNAQKKGTTDKIECKDCGYVGNQEISYNYWKPATSIGATQIVGKLNATCTEAGQTGVKQEYKAKVDASGNQVKDDHGFVVGEWKDVPGSVSVEIPALGHKWVAVSKANSCEEAGYTYTDYRVCERCGDHQGDASTKVDSPKLGHKIVEKSFYDATCQHKGFSVKYCTTCEKFIDANGNAIDPKTQVNPTELANANSNIAPIVKITDMVAHTASDKLANVKEATCTEEGYTGDVVCKFCGEVMKPGEKTKMVDHTPVDVEAQAPTCTEPGISKGTVCKVCKKVLSGQETVPALGHDPKLVNAKDATCTEAGYTGDKVCTRCNVTLEKGKDIKALGHNYVNGLCSRCDAKQPGFNPFSDVKAGPYYNAILWAYENGVAAGKADGTFGVNDPCTRAQIVTFLWRAAGEPIAKNAVNPFSDVSAKSPYYNAILWAVENGITAGTTATTFSPNAPCTRAQIVTFLWRYENKPIVSTLAKFDDVSESSVYYNAIMWAVETGITSGVTKTTFAPNDTCTRGQAVTFIYREFASK